MYATKPLIDMLGNLWNGDIFTERGRYALCHGVRGKLPGYSINLTLAGACRFGLASGPNFIAKAGDVVIVEPQANHVWEVVRAPAARSPGRKAGSDGTWDVVYCGFIPRPTWTPWMQYPHEIPGYARLTIENPAVVEQIRRAFLSMIDFFGGGLPNRSEFQMNLVENILLWCNAHHSARLKGLDPRVQRAVEYLSSRCAERITLAEVAAHAHASRARLASLFHRQVGDSPMRFLEMCRLLRAKELLRLTDQTMDAVAAAVGFCDAKYFARRFHHRLGLPPSKYRATSR